MQTRNVGLLTAVVASALLTNCNEGAHRVVKAHLVDPGSAQFSSERAGKTEGSVCGFVNSRNRMGGFAGTSPYVYDGSSAFINDGPVDFDEFASASKYYDHESFSRAYDKLRSECDFYDAWKKDCGTSVVGDEAEQGTVCRLWDGTPASVDKVKAALGRY